MKKLKIGDIIVISVIMLITAGVFCFRLFGFGEGRDVIISVGGEEKVYSLNEDREIDIESNGIQLCIVIDDGFVYIKDSQCPEQSCVKMGKISKGGRSIACVPSKVYVKIAGEGESYDYIIG